MTMTMKKTDMQSAAADAPVLPTRDNYRDGINKLRHRINCPVLSADEQAIADDLREFDWEAQSASPAAKIPKRPTVSDYLKKQYQANMLARYPEFERRTDCDIAQLRRALDQMYVFNAIVVMLLAVLLLFTTWQLLSMVI